MPSVYKPIGRQELFLINGEGAVHSGLPLEVVQGLLVHGLQPRSTGWEDMKQQKRHSSSTGSCNGLENAAIMKTHKKEGVHIVF